MSDRDVFLTRHGARIDKEDSSWLRKAGHLRCDDPHLSAGGEQGAAELAARLKEIHTETPVSHIVSSPFVRCIETARPVAEALGLQIKVEPGICEVLSTFPPGFLDAKQLQEQFEAVDTLYEPVVASEHLSAEYGDGQAARRAAQAARAVRERLDGRILFVGHGASCLGIAEAFGGVGYVGYTSLSHFTARGGEWRQLGHLGDVAHLSDQRTALASAF
mmetsp:Transcript_4829/g.13323  ORF Transcript_4829/g.13323 Transcript_4829/m.13323 type:complete len:218 (-) Transcript_4829:171-824(-)|eukprot:CAMPEP_0179082084 /NCGR_PEP_ID=MMETSP0796-20121207/36995_1 /TAXON_ID=73915 /ORGANISM="Pyrodinium bahamense, Strain pbaha01" /LENGTH=217 /DNA_ID=CAMNT_0020779479 /DNA_START=60 /DNA_END=713 /DNA_ORIENTATION=+